MIKIEKQIEELEDKIDYLEDLRINNYWNYKYNIDLKKDISLLMSELEELKKDEKLKLFLEM
jgi:hypothetical protein